MATDNTPQRRKMFDGERERELWLPGDGPGDSDLDLVKSSVDRVGGHPTWRIYANDIPGGIVEGGQKPPTRVYLDDKACFDIIQSRAFSGHSKGRNWPFDFTQHGGIRATRPNRGRPALLSDGITIGTCTKPSGTYFFWGADGDPSKKKKHRATSANLDDVEIESPRSPGPMDILRQDDANYAAAFAAVGDDDAMAIDDGVEGDLRSPSRFPSAIPETATSNKRRRLDTLVSRPVSTVDQAELTEIRAEWMGVRTEAQNLRQRTEQLSAELASALDARDNLERDLADARNKEKGSIAKLELKLRECEELRLEINKRTQDAKVVTSMLDKTSRELRELKKNNAEQGLLHNTADEVKALKGEHAALLDLAKSFMRGHAEVKKIIREAQHAGYGEEADAADLTRYISMLGDARQGTEQEVKTLKMGFLNMGHAKLWEELAKELGREKI